MNNCTYKILSQYLYPKKQLNHDCTNNIDLFILRLHHADFETTDRFYVINQSRELVKAVDFLQ